MLLIRFIYFYWKYSVMKSKLIFILLFIVTQAGAQKIDLKSFDWSLKSDTLSLQHIDPSDVYLALLSGNVIGEPFYRDNEKKLQWVGEKKWTFETEFVLSNEVRNRDKIILVFEGLDTYAKVYLNGKLILTADNMFRRWEVNVKSLIKKNNRLKVVFESPLEVIAAARKKGEWKLPYDYGFVRKAPYHFGWDWGPVFVTCGIWKPAYISAWDKARISDVFIEQKKVTPQKAGAQIQVTVNASKNGAGKLEIFRNSKPVASEKISLSAGKNVFTLTDTIANPKLWWPNGTGTPYLYNYKAVVSYKGKSIDSKTVKTGFRTIEIVQQPDSAGTSFFFKVNGVPVFAKGANYIPPDNFMPRVTDDKYRQIITDAKKANMNMLRVWGGGTYEKNLFYELCDENGIMVWQDFMFACNMTPGDSAFLENVKTEARENVTRLRNHPSIALWCGNNEVDEAWHNWGWQKSNHYSASDSAKLWQAYLNIFEKILPQIVEEYTPGTFYWPSSPSIGWGHKEAFTRGDAHYWEVWWGKKPFSYYEKKIGRFMSEYGFQGMPDLKTIDAFTLPGDRVMGSRVLDVHQKHPFGWKAIRQYMERDFPVPSNIDDYDYISQLLQAEGIGMAVEAHRRAKPYCMGTLYWQLNDCWPVVSWSSFDYYGRWKALHYTVKKDYAPFLISFNDNNDALQIWVINDYPSKQKTTLKWNIIDFSGKILASGNENQETGANSSTVICSLNKTMFPGYDSASTVLNAVLTDDLGVLLSENNYYFAKPKNLSLEKPEIVIEIKKIKSGYNIAITSGVLAKGVRLSTAIDGFFEDNYFDLLPNKTQTIGFITTKELKSDDLKIKSLYDVMRHP